MMMEVGRNRMLLASIAAIAIILGLLLMGSMPRAEAPASPPSRQASATGADTENGQAGQFAIRDYAELSRNPESDLPSADWLGLLSGMIVKLLFVIGLIYVAVRVLRHYFYRGRGAVVSKRKLVSLLGSLNLSQNRTVCVLEVARKVLVVGVTPTQLSLLAEVTDAEAIDEMHVLSAETPPIEQFSSLLNIFKRQFGEHDVPASNNSTSARV